MLFLSLFPIPYPTNRFSALRTRLAQLLHFQSAQQALGLTSASARAAANGDAARQRLAEVPVALQLLTRFAPRNDEHTTSKQMVQRKAKKKKEVKQHRSGHRARHQFIFLTHTHHVVHDTDRAAEHTRFHPLSLPGSRTDAPLHEADPHRARLTVLTCSHLHLKLTRHLHPALTGWGTRGTCGPPGRT